MAFTDILGTSDAVLGKSFELGLLLGVGGGGGGSVPFTSKIGYGLSILGKSLRLGAPEVAADPFDQHILQALAFTQTATVNIVINRTLSQTLTFTETATEVEVRNRSLNQTLTFTQDTDLDFDRSLSQTLTFTQAATGVRVKLFTASNTLTFSQTLTRITVHNRSVNQSITFVQSLQRNVIYNLAISHTLIFNDSFKKQLPIYHPGEGNEYVYIPHAMVTIVKANRKRQTVVLQSDNQVIVLPSPEFNDTLENTGQVVIRKSMNNLTYSYVKSASGVKKLQYTFRLARTKSLELRQFVLSNTAKTLTLTNWKGEIWKVKLTINPVSIDPKSRWEPCDRERVDAVLDFEGVRII